MMTDTIFALAADGRRLYAARASGLYCSGDGGQRWDALYDSLNIQTDLQTTALAVAGEMLLAGVPGGVLHSLDAGVNWNFRRFPPPAPMLTALLLTDDFALAATLEDGLYQSADGGASWQPGNYGLLDSCVLALVVLPSGIAYAGTSSGLFRSANGGRSWRQVAFPATPILSLAAPSDRIMLVGTESAGLWRSTDGAQGWHKTAETDEPVNQICAGDNALFAACDCRLLVSRDDGRSWQDEQTFAEPISALAYSGTSLLIALNGEIHAYSPTRPIPAN